MTNNKVLVCSYRTQPAEDTFVLFAKENMTQIVDETRRNYATTEAFAETQNQSTDGQRTQSQSAKKQKSQDFGKIQSQSAKRQRTPLLFDAQGKQGKRSQAIKGNSSEPLEEVRTKVLEGTYSKPYRETSPWFPDVKETKDQSAGKSISKDFKGI